MRPRRVTILATFWLRPIASSPIVAGFGGKQILLDDPAGNPIELFESTRK